MSTSILPVLKDAGLPVVQTLHDYKIACPNTSFVSHDSICESCKGLRYYQMTRKRCKRGSLMASLLATTEMYFHTLFRLYEPNIDVFISPSDFLAHKIREHGITKPIVTIPNFIEPNQFHPCNNPDNYFILVGRLVKIKGVMTLLEAVHRLGSNVELRIAGTGEMEDEMRTFVRENDLNVKFLGHLDTPELVQVVQNALATVQPSEWYENYSMTVIESLACGTPVIGSNIGGIPEQIMDGQNGLLFEPGNAEHLASQMLYLLDNRDIAIEMGRVGRRQVESVNNPEVHYGQTIQLYDDLLIKNARQSIPIDALNVADKSC
jgi:glycosyltransferase involved in cell wall biosynthesis